MNPARNRTDFTVAIEAFHDALDAAGVCQDREVGWVDATGEEIVNALLTAGWAPPQRNEETP